MDIVKIGFDKAPFPILCEHRFSAGNAGELLHFIDGTLRATIPPEAHADYVKHYPDCAPVVRQLADRVKPVAAAVPAKPKAKKRAKRA